VTSLVPKLLSVPGFAQAKRDGLPLIERIDRMSMPEPNSGCWIWLGTGTRTGHGAIRLGRKMVGAHRASWLAHRGSVPNGLHVLHSCDVPCCVNPDHLHLGTAKQNSEEVAARNRRRSGAWRSTSSVAMSNAVDRRAMSPQQRIESLSVPIPECGCWIFLGALRLGYGRLKNHKTGRHESTHRLSWQAYRGAIPNGAMVLHTCDTPSCVNPDHLFLGTQSDNMADRQRKGRNPDVRGENHPGAKLKASQVLEIRASARPRRELAELYAVSKELITAIRNRRVWRHI
jgi:hypothetical protein